MKTFELLDSNLNGNLKHPSWEDKDIFVISLQLAEDLKLKAGFQPRNRNRSELNIREVPQVKGVVNDSHLEE